MAGIDPGSVTGVVVVDVPDSLDFRGARWVAGEAFYPSKAAGLSELGRDCKLRSAIGEFLYAQRVDDVAVECAAEAKIAYRGQRRQRTETAFRSGVYYAIAMFAADNIGGSVWVYPAVTSTARGPGWMGKSPRRVIVPRLVALLQSVGAPLETQRLTPQGDEIRQHHLADALGVLAHHVNDQRLLRAAS